MAFIRVKRAKRKNGNICEYAYIVATKRVWKKVKQSNKKYLGRVYRFNKVKDLDFFEYYKVSNVHEYASSKKKEGILFDLIKLELIKHGFKVLNKQYSKTKNNPSNKAHNIKFFNGNCIFDGKKVFNLLGNPIALGFNQGYLTTYSIRKILNFKAYDEESGYELAKMFVEAGISIPKEIFVEFFNKTLE